MVLCFSDTAVHLRCLFKRVPGERIIIRSDHIHRMPESMVTVARVYTLEEARHVGQGGAGIFLTPPIPCGYVPGDRLLEQAVRRKYQGFLCVE